jgi:energy-coupling factor transporter ATP-binding protein EcfA2
MPPNDAITYFGETNRRPPHKMFGVKVTDRFHHIYAIGRTGTGKSTLLETLAQQDIHAGRGVAVIDPHGDLVERLARSIPKERAQNLIYLNPASGKSPLKYNPLRKVRADKISLAASGVLEAFKKIWGKSWGVRMEHVLRNTLFALIEYGEATLPDILRFLNDRDFRQEVLKTVTNEQVCAYWTDEYARYNPFFRQDAISPIQNKVGAFLADPRLRGLLTGDKKDLQVRRLMDEGKILLLNLSKGELGEGSANLLGALLVSTISLAAFSRAEQPESDRRDFFVHSTSFRTSRRLRSRTWCRNSASTALGSSWPISTCTSWSRMSAMPSWGTLGRSSHSALVPKTRRLLAGSSRQSSRPRISSSRTTRSTSSL